MEWKAESLFIASLTMDCMVIFVKSYSEIEVI